MAFSTGDRSPDRTPEHLLRDIRDGLRKLPDDLASRLGQGRAGGLGDRPSWHGQDQDRNKAEKDRGPDLAEKTRGLEGFGFALGRFVPIFGQIASFSRDIRAVIDAAQNLRGLFGQTAAQKATAAEDVGKEAGGAPRPAPHLPSARVQGEVEAGTFPAPAYVKTGALIATERAEGPSPKHSDQKWGRIPEPVVIPWGKTPDLKQAGAYPPNEAPRLRVPTNLPPLPGEAHLFDAPPRPAYAGGGVDLKTPRIQGLPERPLPGDGPPKFSGEVLPPTGPSPLPAYLRDFAPPVAPPAVPKTEGFPPPQAAGTRPVVGLGAGPAIGGADGGLSAMLQALQEQTGVLRELLRVQEEMQSDSDNNDVENAENWRSRPEAPSAHGLAGLASPSQLQPPRPGGGPGEKGKGKDDGGFDVGDAISTAVDVGLLFIPGIGWVAKAGLIIGKKIIQKAAK